MEVKIGILQIRNRPGIDRFLNCSTQSRHEEVHLKQKRPTKHKKLVKEAEIKEKENHCRPLRPKTDIACHKTCEFA
jgi:hypothetical protein